MAIRLDQQLAVQERDMARLLSMEDHRWMLRSFALIEAKIQSIKRRIVARERRNAKSAKSV